MGHILPLHRRLRWEAALLMLVQCQNSLFFFTINIMKYIAAFLVRNKVTFRSFQEIASI